MKKLIYLIIQILFVQTYSFAQLSTYEKPISFDKSLKLSVYKISDFPVVILPRLDMKEIEKQDKEDEKYDMPPRFGYRHVVSYDLNNSGIWYELSNGDKLWQMNVICPDALSINFCYDKFWLPEGGKFFVYSKDKRQFIGAFTSKNNKGDREHLRGFATELIYGSEVTLEYYQPKDVTQDAVISLNSVVHGYRYIQSEDKSSSTYNSCMVNVNCHEGQNWQNEKKAVALIIIEAQALCTGALINTTSLCEAPLLLTANHCVDFLGKDAANNPNLDNTVFMWNYEMPGCDNSGSSYTYYTTSGAILLSNNKVSDFALLRLDEDPKDLLNYTPFYLGWDKTELVREGVCIHHPGGEVKKISTVNYPPTSTNWSSDPSSSHSHWNVYWKETANGYSSVAEGSSGAPLLSSTHRFIGQLHGGYCNGCEHPELSCQFGKFNVSWTGNNNDSISRRLDCWLDSLNTNAGSVEGLLIIPTAMAISTSEQFYCNIRISCTGQLTIQNDVVMKGKSRVIVESGGTLIIDGGTLSNAELDLKAGSSLQIINNGVIKTKNGFKTPVGALVNIDHGRIL